MLSKTQVPRIGYKKILYTTDLSEAGRQAFPHAASLARAYGADLTVFHVVEPREFEKFLVGYINDDVWDEIKTRNLAEARDILVRRKRENTAIKDSVEQFCRDATEDPRQDPYVTYDVVVELGDPVDRIVEHAHNGGYDLVIIGKRGGGVMDGGLMGDTARRVIRHCRVPVMVVQVQEKSGDD
jgi:nucleotide-binding universal stress UspA family protein